MMNGKIAGTYLGLAKNGDEWAMAAQLVIATKEKQYGVGPIVIQDLNAIGGILQVGDTPNWEGLNGQVIQFDVNEEDKVTKIVNVIDESLFLNFSEVAQPTDTSNQEEKEN